MENKDGGRKLICKRDIFIIVSLIAVFCAAFALWSKTGGGAHIAVITADKIVIDRIALDKDCDIEYPELPGVVFRAENGTVRIIQNDCGDLTCVRTGAISRKGEAIICMPKKIVVEIEGESEGPDVVLR